MRELRLIEVEFADTWCFCLSVYNLTITWVVYELEMLLPKTVEFAFSWRLKCYKNLWFRLLILFSIGFLPLNPSSLFLFLLSIGLPWASHTDTHWMTQLGHWWTRCVNRILPNHINIHLIHNHVPLQGIIKQLSIFVLKHNPNIVAWTLGIYLVNCLYLFEREFLPN